MDPMNLSAEIAQEALASDFVLTGQVLRPPAL
jgi:hypothetical protein